MSSDLEFWESCAAAECVILPVKCYSGYGADGNLDESKLIGIRYAALKFDNYAVGPDYWFMIDESQVGMDQLFETPQDAFAHLNNLEQP